VLFPEPVLLPEVFAFMGPLPEPTCATDPRSWPAVEFAYGNVLFVVVSRYKSAAGQPWHCPMGWS
jgi:hypothetical protein